MPKCRFLILIQYTNNYWMIIINKNRSFHQNHYHAGNTDVQFHQEWKIKPEPVPVVSYICSCIEIRYESIQSYIVDVSWQCSSAQIPHCVTTESATWHLLKTWFLLCFRSFSVVTGRTPIIFTHRHRAYTHLKPSKGFRKRINSEKVRLKSLCTVFISSPR